MSNTKVGDSPKQISITIPHLKKLGSSILLGIISFAKMDMSFPHMMKSSRRQFHIHSCFDGQNGFQSTPSKPKTLKGKGMCFEISLPGQKKLLHCTCPHPKKHIKEQEAHPLIL